MEAKIYKMGFAEEGMFKYIVVQFENELAFGLIHPQELHKTALEMILIRKGIRNYDMQLNAEEDTQIAAKETKGLYEMISAGILQEEGDYWLAGGMSHDYKVPTDPEVIEKLPELLGKRVIT